MGISANAQERSTHPRVLEVEKMINREALDFLRARFPGRPFIVTSTVDPLRRPKKGEGAEVLPYYEMDDEEQFDEWDDKTIPTATLISRVKKIGLVITVPADLTEDDLTEIKASLLPSLGLVEGRDTIEIRKRSWLGAPPEDSSKLSWYNVSVISGLLVLFLGGMLAVLLLAANRVSRGLGSLGASKDSGAEAPAAVQISPSAVGGGLGGGGVDAGSSRSSGGLGGSSDVRMLDSLEFLEHVQSGIKFLNSHADFPRLEDMLIFESFAEKNPGEFGSFLLEMPYDLRMKIFGYSQSLPWLDAMTQPTDVGKLTLDCLRKCLRVQRNDKEVAWQNLLVLVWRLKDHGQTFFQGIPQNDAMAIMAHLPKGDGLHWARMMFPGSWGQILDASFRPKPLDELTIRKYSEKALSILPLRKADVVDNYRAEKEVLQYVRMASVQSEREVYMAAGESSSIRAVRAPFYPFFDMNAEQYKVILAKFNMEEWAIALFDTPKPDRKIFESIMSQKQKVRLYEMFRRLEAKHPGPIVTADVRERIGVQVAVITAPKLSLVKESDGEASAGEAESKGANAA